jgi:hypothetical protein
LNLSNEVCLGRLNGSAPCPRSVASPVFARPAGYLYRGGFSRDINQAMISSTRKAARDAAHAAAKLYGMVVEVRPTMRRSWRDLEAELTARTTANRVTIDTFLAAQQADGLLTLREPFGRTYTH